MNLFRTTAAVLALTTGLLTMPTHADEMVQNQGQSEGNENVSGNQIYNADAPAGYAMFGDLVIARPLLIGATLLGTAAFIVSLPFSALGGNVKEAGEALVLTPGREAFVRCLGCTTSGYQHN